MDTRFWGPSGWELLHLITFEKGYLSKKKELFSTLPFILPCKYCRESALKFMNEDPLTNNLALWLYEFHNKVNKKLSDQGLNPQPSPGFMKVMEIYKNKLKNLDHLPGTEFLLSIAFNYDDKLHCKDEHLKFWNNLKYLYPKDTLDTIPRISKEYYFKDTWTILNNMGYEKSFNDTFNYIKKFKSQCTKKTFRGKTCRKKKKPT